MDATGLKSTIANWIARSDLADADLNTMVQLAEARIYRVLRIADLEKVFFGNLDADGKTAVPSDYMQFKELALYQGGGTTSTFSSFASATRIVRIQRTSGEVLLDRITRNSGSPPASFARVGGNFVVAPLPTGTYSLGGIYYARPASILATITSSLLDKFPDLFLSAGMMEASGFVQDPDKIALWKGRFDEVLGEIQDAEDLEVMSGTMPVTSSGVR